MTHLIFTKSCLMQIFIAVVTNIYLLPLGANMGFSAVALPAMQNASAENRITEEQASWIASITTISMPVGILCTGVYSRTFGRRVNILTINGIFAIGWAIIALASADPKFEYPTLLTGRFVTGIANGMGPAASGIYLSEISTTKIRGFLIAWPSTSMSIGIAAIYVLGYFFEDSWRMMAAICSAVSVVGLVAVWAFVPETPSWLVSRSRTDDARRSLARIRCADVHSPDVQRELEGIVVNVLGNDSHGSHDGNNAPCSVPGVVLRELKHYKHPACWKPFLIIVLFLYFENASGIIVVVFYAVDMMQRINVRVELLEATVYLGLLQLAASVVGSFWCRRSRRSPAILSGTILTLSALGLVGYLYADQRSLFPRVLQQNLSWLPLVLIIAYLAGGMVGFFVIPYAMMTELLPVRIRDIACNLAVCLAFFSETLLVKMYPNMMRTMGPCGVLAFYGANALVGTLFVIIFLPETQGKTMQEIEDYFTNKTKKSNENNTSISTISSADNK